jgi:uncharacterized protein (DUF362 family)
LKASLPQNPNGIIRPFQCPVTRREFITRSAYFLVSSWIFSTPFLGCRSKGNSQEVFITKVDNYNKDISSAIKSGFRELNVLENEIKGKRILLKVNIVEPRRGTDHIVTHPLVIRGAIEAFKTWGAREVIVSEGSGHCRDTYRILEESGMVEILREDRIPFIDLNYQPSYSVPNQRKITNLASFTFPKILKEVDWIVSMPKMKTHHWAGVTLSMKNMFGVMPGMFYGWPKNILHVAGIDGCIVDINTTLRPHFAIIDGIIGMEGDGPIMGVARQAGLLVMGRNLLSVDATAARVMGVNPAKIKYMANSRSIGQIRERQIYQRGEKVLDTRTDFVLLNKIGAHGKLL